MENRILWVDYAKVIGIYLVILGHTSLLTSVQNIIYTFHMPLFFFISGYLFSFEKHSDLGKFVKRRFRQLMIPYFFFSIVTFLFWVLIGRKFGNDFRLDVPLYQPIAGILYGNGIKPWMIHCIPLWFFPCLFLVENLYYLIFRNLKNKMAGILILVFIVYLYIQFNTIRFPWSLNTAIVALAIYGLGNVSRTWIKVIHEQKVYFQIPLAIIGILSVYFVAQYNGRINMHAHDYGNYFLFLTGALSGIIALIVICGFLGHFIKRNFWIEYISKNTFIIVGFHLMVGSVIKAITFFIFKFPLDIYETNLWVNVAYSFATLIILLPVIYVLNFYFPFFLGGNTRVYTKDKPVITIQS